MRSHAITLVGVKLDRNDLFAEKTEPGCDCGAVRDGDQFCPACGKKALKIKKILKQDFGDEDQFWDLEGEFKPVELDDGSGKVYLASWMQETSSGEHVVCSRTAPDLYAHRHMMSAFLAAMGLWDKCEPGFGLYTIAMYV